MDKTKPRLSIEFGDNLYDVHVSVYGEKVGMITTLNLDLGQGTNSKAALKAHVSNGPEGQRKKELLIEAMNVIGLEVALTTYDESDLRKTILEVKTKKE